MKTPIEQMLDLVDWAAIERTEEPKADLPHATHSGVLTIGAIDLKVFRLSNGMAVIDADDMQRFLGSLQ